ncbi:hypothetical protein JDN40_02910 [Rhodomicrobium vannielii ATCC 17100]|uniref:hypothetical protein n=1 Tax=Rhodomicrobium vannielii TaxID=1069 RepID=UPI001918E1DC|nr:hypothetical protein [Rhodomicrobium vannielii]MBJ7533065.1 hypothetical protein [Rhodomicrobium vannielii ATCC 17100]
MFERSARPHAYPAPLALGADGGIVTTLAEPIVGWPAGNLDGAPQPLILPPNYLDPLATSAIAYGCNLPLTRGAVPTPVLGAQFPDRISGSEAEFLAASFPAGNTAVIGAKGERITLRLRWVCVSADAGIGAVWRCFVRLGGHGAQNAWHAVDHDYIFEAKCGTALNAPEEISLPVRTPDGRRLRLVHPFGALTCFACEAGRVKVTKLASDGWAKRDVARLSLLADDRVVAIFSDGMQKTVGIAAPHAKRTARAA